MATNFYFSQGVKSEQDLYESIVIESIKIYGQDVYYLPRDLVDVDSIFQDDPVSKFNSSYKIEMYIENDDGFDGEGDIFTKFGVEIRDNTTFVVARSRWSSSVKKFDNEITSVRPLEGDLIYLPLTKKFFKITRVEHEYPFYQLKNVPTYRLFTELFEYTGEDIDTNVVQIDNVEKQGYEVVLTLQDSAKTGFIIGNTIRQLFSDSAGASHDLTAEITEYNDSNNILKVTHVGSSDGKFRMFSIGDISSLDSTGIEGNRFTRRITAVNEELNQITAQNTGFDTVTTDFLDFSEDNPFGDPSDM